MWLFTKHGFFSAVQNKNDANLIHVRARFKGDLEKLCKTYGVTPRVDPYRMDFNRISWMEIVKCEAVTIDYTDFENAVHDGTKRDAAYKDVWATLKRYQ